MDRFYDHHHVVGFEETNLVGNVYYVNYIRWQSRCREMFLLDDAPDVLDSMREDGFKLFTLKSDCEFIAEIAAFDELSVRMRMDDLTQTQIGLTFEYVRIREGLEDLIARGTQRLACVRDDNGRITPTRVPDSLRTALQRYRTSKPQRVKSGPSKVGGRA